MLTWIWLVILISILIVFLIAYICFRVAFYVPATEYDPNEISIPEGAVYEPFRDIMTNWVREIRAMPYKEFEIISFDGLKLHGRFYEFAPGAPIELMFHGYRGDAERDLSGGVQRCFQLGRSALIVNQRASRGSEGNVISFGINEHKDCLSWVDFMVDHFGPDVKIILTGISMGASTVLMAAGKPLPHNVIGVLADCGFNSAKDIMFSVMRNMGLPPKICWPFVKLGARFFGHFDLEADSAEEAVKHCRVPVIFFHGEDDDFVPAALSKKNFDACASKKKLVLIPGASHGLSYPVAPEKYLAEAREFFGKEASHPSTW